MCDKLSFNELSSRVIEQLKYLGYMDSTLTVYRRTFNRINTFMKSTGATAYTKQLGEDFLRSTKVCKSTMVAYRCAVRRLNDFAEGKPYTCHVRNEEICVPEVFADTLDNFASSCKSAGNKPLTIKEKVNVCSRFLQFIDKRGYTDLTALNAEVVSQSLNIYTNYDNYACLRLFLKYLYDEGIIENNLSLIVPRYKRRKPIPTVYSPVEVLQIESSIDNSTDTGKRNLAMIRLASRMGFRAGDISKLKWSEIDFCSGHISIIQEKTGVPLSLLMPQDVIDALKEHADSSPGSYDEYVFHQMVAPYDRVSTSTIRHAVNDAIVASGVDYSGKKHGPHALRSSLASSMVNDGETYETVRHLLGHSDPDVIKHYAKVDIENLRRCSIIPPSPSGRFKDFLNGKGAM